MKKESPIEFLKKSVSKKEKSEKKNNDLAPLLKATGYCFRADRFRVLTERLSSEVSGDDSSATLVIDGALVALALMR